NVGTTGQCPTPTGRDGNHRHIWLLLAASPSPAPEEETPKVEEDQSTPKPPYPQPELLAAEAVVAGFIPEEDRHEGRPVPAHPKQQRPGAKRHSKPQVNFFPPNSRTLWVPLQRFFWLRVMHNDTP